MCIRCVSRDLDDPGLILDLYKNASYAKTGGGTGPMPGSTPAGPSGAGLVMLYPVDQPLPATSTSAAPTGADVLQTCWGHRL
jgi:hypothetical protein